MRKNNDAPDGESVAPAHLLLGASGEEAASCFLENQGCAILDRNWRDGGLELDIVCERGELLIFVEVKTRTSGALGGPLAGMTPRKKRNLILAAQAWLAEREAWHRPCRLDVICLVKSGAGFAMEYFPNAIELSHTLDCSGAAGEFW